MTAQLQELSENLIQKYSGITQLSELEFYAKFREFEKDYNEFTKLEIESNKNQSPIQSYQVFQIGHDIASNNDDGGTKAYDLANEIDKKFKEYQRIAIENAATNLAAYKKKRNETNVNNLFASLELLAEIPSVVIPGMQSKVLNPAENKHFAALLNDQQHLLKVIRKKALQSAEAKVAVIALNQKINVPSDETEEKNIKEYNNLLQYIADKSTKKSSLKNLPDKLKKQGIDSISNTESSTKEVSENESIPVKQSIIKTKKSHHKKIHSSEKNAEASADEAITILPRSTNTNKSSIKISSSSEKSGKDSSSEKKSSSDESPNDHGDINNKSEDQIWINKKESEKRGGLLSKSAGNFGFMSEKKPPSRRNSTSKMKVNIKNSKDLTKSNDSPTPTITTTNTM